MTHIPAHVSIIPDGNRRWAKLQLKALRDGYAGGADNVLQIIEAAQELGIKHLSFFGWSTENWKRGSIEASVFFNLFEEYLRKNVQKLLRNSIRFRSIGHIDLLPPPLIQAIKECEEITKNCTGLDLVFAMNYGGRDELLRSIKKIALAAKNGQLEPETLTEKEISRYLDTHDLPDPDLIIRTSGEKRISNFLLWQSCYAEFFVSDDLWPNFSPRHLVNALVDYQNRSRRAGG